MSKTYGSLELTKRSKEKMVNNTIDLLLSWGLDYDELHAALDNHRKTVTEKELAR